MKRTSLKQVEIIFFEDGVMVHVWRHDPREQHGHTFQPYSRSTKADSLHAIKRLVSKAQKLRLLFEQKKLSLIPPF